MSQEFMYCPEFHYPTLSSAVILSPRPSEATFLPVFVFHHLFQILFSTWNSSVSSLVFLTNAQFPLKTSILSVPSHPYLAHEWGWPRCSLHGAKWPSGLFLGIWNWGIDKCLGGQGVNKRDTQIYIKKYLKNIKITPGWGGEGVPSLDWGVFTPFRGGGV